MNIMLDRAQTDAQLWDACRQGDREAFGALVTRYQGLVCSLAYSRTGSVALSEEVAQETFLAAWLQIGQLRQPEKLRAWLAGIVRNLAGKAARGRSVPLEDVAEPPELAAGPEAQAVSRQEEELVWQALERIPDTYREPLILFYRESESVESVAAMLDLSTDAVKQRLSRGRALVREELAGQVEQTLSRTRPGRAFTAAVLGVLPQGMGAAVAGPAVGLSIAWTAARLAGMTARDEQERADILRAFRSGILFTVAMVAVLLLLVWGTLRLGWSPWLLGVGSYLWTAALLRRLLGLGAGLHRDSTAARRIESQARLFGLPLFCYSSGGTDVTARHGTARGWIAVGDMAISPLLAIGGTAIAPIALGGISIGIVSTGALAFGLWALGFQAAGWVAAGPLALAWRGAWGGLALAHDFALGAMARAAEANTVAAAAWIRNEWWTGPASFLLRQAWWLVLLSIVVPLLLLARRAWRSR